MSATARLLSATAILLCSSHSASLAAPVLTLEPAPGKLRHQTGRDLLIAADESGQGLYVFDPEDNNVQQFSEQGEVWGSPIRLHPTGLDSLPRFSRFDVSSGLLVFSGSQGVSLFSLEGVQTKHLRIFQPGDAVAIDSSTVAVSLVNIPHPKKPGAFLARSSFGEQVPRVAFFGREGQLEAAGLLEGEDGGGSPSSAMGRALKLAWADDHLYAAELGSYRVDVLDRKLKLKQFLEDPDLQSEEAPGSELPAELDDKRDPGVGHDAATGSKPTPAARLSFKTTPVIADIAWGPKPGRLYLLLDRESFRGKAHIDVLDEVEGAVRRSGITRGTDEGGETLKQIAVTRKYIWLRAYPEGSPILRVSRSDLDQGEILVFEGEGQAPLK